MTRTGRPETLYGSVVDQNFPHPMHSGWVWVGHKPDLWTALVARKHYPNLTNTHSHTQIYMVLLDCSCLFLSFICVKFQEETNMLCQKNKEKKVKATWGRDIQICMKKWIFQDDSCLVSCGRDFRFNAIYI